MIGIAIFILVLVIFKLILTISDYIDGCRQEEIQTAWDIYSRDMDFLTKVRTVTKFAMEYQAQKGWNALYVPQIQVDKAEIDE